MTDLFWWQFRCTPLVDLISEKKQEKEMMLLVVEMENEIETTTMPLYYKFCSGFYDEVDKLETINSLGLKFSEKNF